MNLIDKDSIHFYGGVECDLWITKRMIDALPTVDIVRCKDCINFHLDRESIGFCEEYNSPMTKNDFCSYGRRENYPDEIG